MRQSFGSGGSPSAQVNTLGGSATLSTSWARYTLTFAVPSISGKTIGTAGDSNLQLLLWLSAGSDFNASTGSIGLQNNTFQFWGVQVEAASTASNFQTATGTKQGELAACQRYYWRNTASATFSTFGQGFGLTTTGANFILPCPSQMRITPTVVEFSTLRVTEYVSTSAAVTALSLSSESSPLTLRVNTDVASGLTKGVPYGITANNSTSAYIGFSAEL